jgi:hypothetical protein
VGFSAATADAMAANGTLNIPIINIKNKDCKNRFPFIITPSRPDNRQPFLIYIFRYSDEPGDKMLERFTFD